MDLSAIKKILVIKLRHIGDVLLTTPTLRALKRAMPGARLTVVVPSGTQDMLTLNPDVDEVLTFERGLVKELKLTGRIMAGGFDLAINMTEGDRGAIMAFLSGARLRIGIDPLGRGMLGKKALYTHTVRWVYDGRHRVRMDMEVLRPLGIDPAGEDFEPKLFTSPDDELYVARLLEERGVSEGAPIAAVHPTSRWFFKCWKDEAVAEVMDYLTGRGVRVVVTSGPDKREVDRAGGILKLAKPGPVDLSGALTLKRLAALYKKSSLFFGVDTAPMHIAAAVGTPVVALFGPSDYRAWGPYTKNAKVIVKTGEFECIPCLKDGCDGSKKSKCLEAITAEEAIAAIEELLAGIPSPCSPSPARRGTQ